MALIGNSDPKLYVEGSATQTGGSGNSRTVKITAKFKVNGSSNWYYGYPCNWRARVNSSYGSWTSIKGTETWNGGQALRTFEQTLTVDVGTTNSTNITVGIYTDHPSYNYWNGSYTWTFAVGATNVAPTMPTSAPELSPGGTIPENTATIRVVSPTASDGNGNLSGYRCRVSINGGGYSEVYRGGARDFIHNVQGYGEGTSFAYVFDAYDASGAWSGNSGTGYATKNTMTGGWFTGHSGDINYWTTAFTLMFTGGGNTNGSGVTYLCYSDNVTVYNQQETSSASQTISIWRDGEAVPSGPYMKFTDLRNYFASSSYNGRLHVGLRTRNNYGTDKWAGGSVGVDLRVNPQPARDYTIADDPNLSTIYKKVASSDNYYYIPDGSGVARVHWNNGWGHLGEGIRYEVYVAYGGGGWQKVADVPHNGEYHYFNHVIGKQNTSQQFKYLIRTVTSYGYYSDVETAARTLHYYNEPGLSVGTITRGATTAEINVTVKTNSSIPNINTTGSWYTDPNTVSGNLTVSQTEQKISLTGLTDSGTYTLRVTYGDNTGFSGNKTANIAIGQNSPILFVNKYGIGVNGRKGEANAAVNVKGRLVADDAAISGVGIGTYASGVNDINTDLRTRGGIFNGPRTSTVNALPWGHEWSYYLNMAHNNPNGYNGVIALDFGGNELGIKGISEGLDSGWKRVWHSGNFDITNPTVNTLSTTSSGQSNNIRLGDDCYIGDCNDADTFRVMGNQNNAKGYIQFGNGAKIGYGGGTSLDILGGTYISGSLDVTDNIRAANRLYFTSNEMGYWLGAEWNLNRACIRMPNLVTSHIVSDGDIRASGNFYTPASTAGVWGFEPNRQDVGRARLANSSNHGSLRLEGWNPYGTFVCDYMFTNGWFAPGGGSGNHGLGNSSTSGRWGQIYSTVGSISTSDSRVKENIKKIATTEKAALMSREPVDMETTGEDMWNYVKGVSAYSYNYKERYISAGESKDKEWLGILADEIPDNIFNKIGLMSKTQEQHEEDVAKQIEYKKIYEEELAKIPSILSEDEDESTYDIEKNYGNEIVEGTGLTRREIKRKAEEQLEEPIRLINSSAQIAMLQEVLSLAISKIESLESRIAVLENK